MNLPAPIAPAHVSSRPGRRRLRLVVGVFLALVVALIVLFEVGIRHVPPDDMAVTYDYKFNASAYMGTRTYTAPKDQQTIRDAYAAFNDARVVHVTVGDVAGCSLIPYPSMVVFTWHGVPVESWTSTGCEYFESAGGFSDEFVIENQQVLHIPPHITFPLPPPQAG